VKIHDFARKIHRGEIRGSSGPFTQLLIIGIGGSALGPQFVAQALGQPGEDRLQIHFFDNTDPDGIDLALSPLRGKLGETLSLVVSKSGGTPETRNGMLEAVQAYLSEGLDFARHAVAVTGEGSMLDEVAVADKWLERFPMWDWVGGRTSELATVGLLPAALQGIEIDEILDGAAQMDTLTRNPELTENPAGILAAMWYHATGGTGKKDMVILPYKDRLMLFSKYLQQLIMESLGKEKDLDGNTVHQGIAVYGNKGSTDQHAYVQQLREGVNNFFATFIKVLKDREGASINVDDGATTGDFLNAFLLGTREALSENNRESLMITIDEVTPRNVGILIALYERAVGFYATLVNVNAYHQPGVEAGKKAAARFLDVQRKLLEYLTDHRGESFSIEKLASALDLQGDEETLFLILEHAAANPGKGVLKKLSKKAFDNNYGMS
jgi:glucose-6-phosphate isomerase